MNQSTKDWLLPRLGCLLIFLTVALILGGISCTIFYFTLKHGPSPADPIRALANTLPPPAQPLPGEPILQNYASPATRPEEDLSMMAHALGNLTLLIKGQPLRLSANEEFAAALRGQNPARLRFLPDTHPAFNGRYQIVDRWQTPLFFHPLSHDRLDIRSAGPDRQMWTADDLHRHYDGQFLTAPALNSPSLFNDTPSSPPSH